MGGPSGSTIGTQQGISQQQINLANQQQGQAGQIFSSAFPGFNTSENFYSGLGSGDPTKIAAMMGPANQVVRQQDASTKANIDATMPRGGEKNLAKEMSDVTSAGQISRNATQGYTSAFPALSQLFSTGGSLSNQSIANAIAGLSGGANTMAQVGQEQAAGKGSSLGFLGSLAGAGGELGSGAMLAAAL